MSKKEKHKTAASNSLYSLPFEEYNAAFERLAYGEKRILEDIKSDKNSFMPIEVTDDQVFLTEPDQKLIPDIQDQQKCDFLIYCPGKLQSCFIELKGENISGEKKYNPYDQIGDTIDFLKNNEKLKGLVNQKMEKHAFIVSPGRQKIPKNIESGERFLWQKLVQKNMKKKNIRDLIHYVKVTKSDRYSNNKQIICSPKSPVKIPFVE